MEFFVAGASAVQIGTASFAEPVITGRILDELPAAVNSLGASELQQIVGTLVIGDHAKTSAKAGE
jgi:dihydroorotate dehydrogenase (NAD+) catalytic subunit